MVYFSAANNHPSTYEVLDSIVNPTDKSSSIYFNPTFEQDAYEIDYIRPSENAWLFFTRHLTSNRHVVMKILRPLKDTRYNLDTLEARQYCQVEALRWNQTFTQGVYLGLACIGGFDQWRKRIYISKIFAKPDEKLPYYNADYVLLMDELPKDQRLDMLLKEGNKNFHQMGDRRYYQYYSHILTKFMVHLHSDENIMKLTSLSSSDGKLWGSVDQLKEKLTHNFAFVNQSLMKNDNPEYANYYKSLENMLNVLQIDLLQVFSECKKDFDERLRNGRIRRCHGDLKARNIWINPCNLIDNRESWRQVSVLDAVDFNSLYSNIDILSDFAMLVVDVQARTKSSSLADTMIKDYLQLTKQQDTASKLVLAYYLVEKAFVGAIVNIIYDNWPSLGLSFLDIVERRMKDLKRQINNRHDVQSGCHIDLCVKIERKQVGRDRRHARSLQII
jgi:aminoglycoside phosphotransferase family enzyme